MAAHFWADKFPIKVDVALAEIVKYATPQSLPYLDGILIAWARQWVKKFGAINSVPVRTQS